MIAHPLGLGLGTSGRVAGSLGENVGGENQFIIIGVQAGIIALFLYLAIYIMFVKAGLKWLNKLKGKERKVCMAVLLIKIGFFIPMLTSEVESSSYLSYMDWFLSGLFISMIMYPVQPQLQPANDN
jgi:O-antigen ligase